VKIFACLAEKEKSSASCHLRNAEGEQGLNPLFSWDF